MLFSCLPIDPSAVTSIGLIAAPWLVEIALSATGLVLAWLMVEPPDAQEPAKAADGEARAGAWLAARGWRNDGRLHLRLLACATAILAVALVSSAGIAAAAVALAFFPGLIHPLRAAALQRVAADGVRARMASFASACDIACTTLGLLAAGAVSARRRI